jgi:cobalt/nickel transport protein
MLVLAGGVALGHFHTYWPDSPNGYATLGGQVTWQYFWGHPYEFVVFDAEAPQVHAVAPDGSRTALTPEPKAMADPETGGERSAFAFSYTPQAIGDHWIVLDAPPYLIEEEGEAVQDSVKQCLHVMAEVGWDRRLGLPVELVPLTRPYGLEAGFAFSARAYLDGEPLAGATVEIEKFNGFPVPAGKLPTDQFGVEDVPMITRTAKTDALGYITYTLDEPGWWMVSVSAQSGTVEVEGTGYPRVMRGGLWVHVEEPFAVAP